MPFTTRMCGGTPTRSTPSKRIEPPVTVTCPAIARSNVDLPAPLAPMIASVSPSVTVSDTPNSAWKSP